MSQTVAAIDCGTNSIRLLIARRGEDGTLVDLEREMVIVRLGQGVDARGAFDPEAVERTLNVTRQYAEAITRSGAEAVRFVATSATRDAANRDLFIDGVRQILGVAPEVISGAEEAELSFSGAVTTLGALPAGPRLVVDIGGGSTELVMGTDSPEHRVSLDIGSVRMTERHLRQDPPTAAEIAAATADIDARLDEAEQTVPLAQTACLVGVAGTVTTLTAIAEGVTEYSPEVTHGAVVDIDTSLEHCQRLLTATRAKRARIPALHPGRVDVIGGGALIWARILERVRDRAGLTRSVTSEHDILDGIALELLGRTDR